MQVKEISIENFTVFEKLKIDFSKGINILIGENGTGKTHLMKMMYAPFSQGKQSRIFWEDVFTHNIEEARSSEYFRRNKSKEFSYIIQFGEEKEYSNLDGKINQRIYNCGAVFIPTTEMLSHSKGFLASLFKENILNRISEIIGGKVVYEKDTFYIIKKDGLKVEFSMEAEGIRKIGLLWRLIQNGLIDKNSILFWDEPEANINPKYIPALVEILLELQRNGVQIFVTTHDYIFSKYFDIKRLENDKVMYYSLYKTNNGVECENADKLSELNNNQIRDTFIQLYEDEIKRAME